MSRRTRSLAVVIAVVAIGVLCTALGATSRREVRFSTPSTQGNNCMFIGHFATGLAAKRIAPRASLGTQVFLAAQFIDLIWPVFVLLGLERVEIDPGNTVINPINFVSYPITHSLFGVLLSSLLFGGVYFIARRSAQSSLVLGALVLSHWVLNLIAHRPDLPLVPWSDVKVGIGLWNSLPLTVLFEGSLFALGALQYSVRVRSPWLIMQELWYLKKLGLNWIHMYADLFTVSRDQVVELCKLMIEEKINMRWMCNSRVDYVDEEMLELMGKAGCYLISWGLESGNEQVLRHARKGISWIKSKRR